MSRIEIKKIKITDGDVDCIVCPANNYLLAAGGINREIFTKAGRPELLDLLKGYRYCETGKAVITTGANLKQKFVAHAVGPIWTDGEHGEPEQLEGAYYNSMRLAKENGCTNIMFPLLSVGAFGYPVEYAWEIAIGTSIKFLKECDSDFDIYFALYEDNYIAAGQKELAKQEKELNASDNAVKIDFIVDDTFAGVGEEGNFIFFLGDQEENGYLSKWFKQPFSVDGVRYSCVEQYIMSKKALAMGDVEYYALIMHEESQQEMRNLGRKIRNFERDRWFQCLPKILYDANLAKFSQNKDLERKLLFTEEKVLVCADPDNRIYGVGLASFEPEVRDVNYWCGKNLLGEALMKVRKEIRDNKAKSER